MLFGPVRQLAYVVADPALAAMDFAQRHGAGPFFIARHIVVDSVVHRGEPSSFDHTSAYGWWGEVMIELFCQHDRAPSAVTERFGPDELGLHHLACFVDDLDEALRRASAANLATAMIARAGATRFAFVDDVVRRGHYWELYEPTERLLGFYDMVRSAHDGWIGDRPVRELG